MRAAGHLLEPLAGDLGAGGHAQAVGLVLEDQGVDQLARVEVPPKKWAGCRSRPSARP